jgi:hypothetical protein
VAANFQKAIAEGKIGLKAKDTFHKIPKDP